MEHVPETKTKSHDSTTFAISIDLAVDPSTRTVIAERGTGDHHVALVRAVIASGSWAGVSRVGEAIFYVDTNGGPCVLGDDYAAQLVELGLARNEAGAEALINPRAIAFRETTWRKRGRTHEAIVCAWPALDECLGRPHEGDARDDSEIVAALLSCGAPAWVATAEGDVDDESWALLGPIVEVQSTGATA
ncbi:MAG: hypothetical protein ACHREM_24980 [Polyangiales bacterium]